MPSSELNDLGDTAWQDAPCGLVIADLNGRIRAANLVFADLVGVPEPDLLDGRTFASLLSAGSRIYFETFAAQLLHLQGRADALALTLVRCDGDRIPVLANLCLYTSGGTGRLQVAIFDAASRAAFERDLLEARRRAEASEAQAALLARTLQATLLPPVPPVVPGLDIATAYRPAGAGDQVGGDFYDIFELGGGEWTVILGDVSGKGAAAAVVSSLARHTLRAACARYPTPSAALYALHRALSGADTDRFCTAVVMRLRETGGRWSCTMSVGGHSLPLIASPDGSIRPVGIPGSLVGAISDPTYFDSDVTLDADELLFLCTDGVSEGRRASEFYGEDRLCAHLANRTGGPQTTVRSLLADVLAFQDGHPRDDIAIVAIQVRVT